MRIFYRVMVSATLFFALSGVAFAGPYNTLFDSYWLPLVHDWTLQLHEPRGAEFRQISVPDERSIYWEYSVGDVVWSELQFRRPDDGHSTNVRRGDDEVLALQSEGKELAVRIIDGDSVFTIATYRRVDEASGSDTIAGEWDFGGRPLTIVEVPPASKLDVFILREDVPVVNVPRGAYIVEEVSEGVIKAKTFGLRSPFYILFDPTDDDRLWITTDEVGPDVEPWIDHRGMDVAFMNRLDETRIENR